MSRIVLVSNRVTDVTTASQAGGLSVAIADIMLNRSALWFGWNGEVTDVDDVPAIVGREEIGNSVLVSMPLSESEFRDYYLGYSNSVLWPVFHNRLDLAQFEAGFFPEYMRVNVRFAAELFALLRDDDIIWVHDYHLIPLAAELRALGAENPIGFFLHVPAPPVQAYLAIPEHVEIATALSAYDLVGVQTQQDAANLIDIFQHSVSGRLLQDGRIRVAGRPVQIISNPVSIDINEFVGEADDSAVMAEGVEFRIVGIDRLDYTKGLPHKFRAYGRFLEQNPEYRRRVVLAQIAPPTRETLEAYSDIRAELESLSGSINGRYSELDWMPIYYMHRGISRKQLFGIYRGSKVGLVTPLRDGMNLVAKEYVAAQDPNDPGVLVLSRFAGAAEQLQDAVIVNPYNIAEMADAIRVALEMPLKERKRRHRALLDVISANGSQHWTDTFLSELANISARKREMRDAGNFSEELDDLRGVRSDA